MKRISEMTVLRNMLILSLVLVSFCACGDDELGGIRYRYSRYVNFEVYAGEGGDLVRVRMDSIQYFYPVVEQFTDAMITFDEDRIQVGQVSISESSPYKFEDGKLYIYNDEVWQYFGYGNEGKVTIRQNYASYRDEGGRIQRFRGPSQETYTVEEAIVNTPFGSLSGMTEKDTLVICTRDSYFN